MNVSIFDKIKLKNIYSNKTIMFSVVGSFGVLLLLEFLHQFNFLLILLSLPLITAVVIWLLPNYAYDLSKNIAITMSIIIFIFSMKLLFEFDNSEISFQFIQHFEWLSNWNIYFTYGIDGISIFFVILTAFLIPICIISSWENTKYRVREFLVLLFFIEFLLFQVFSILDIILFYIFFESVLIPMFLIIGIWGARDRKIHAAYQFFLYTFFGSVFMLLSIIYIYNNIGTTDYITLLHVKFAPMVEYVLWLAFFISFAVKIPMVPVHIWLPEAHVEAPTAGSVLLAGVLLKLGTYGLIRFSIPLFPHASEYFTPFVLTISVIAIIYSSCTTLRQTDLKKIIAYSSVAHMNLVTIGIFSNSINGIEGALTLMLSHGLVSSGLFLCVGVLYDRYDTRLINYYGGLVAFMPLFSFFFMVLSLANMGLPGTSAFIGEFLILMGAFTENFLVSFLASIGVILSAAYSVWLYNRVMFGQVRKNIQKYSDVNSREFAFLAFIVILVIIFGINANPILETMHTSTTNILASINYWFIYDESLITDIIISSEQNN